MPASMYGQQLFGREAEPHGATSHAQKFNQDVSVRGGVAVVWGVLSRLCISAVVCMSPG